MIDAARYPKKKPAYPVLGLNLSDTALEADILKHAQELRNLIFTKNSMIQRKPFVQYSSEVFSTEGIKRGVHEYIDTDGSARFLFGTNSGKIIEYLTSSTHAERVAGLSSSKDLSFADSYDSVVAVNGVEAKTGRKTSWEDFGAHAPVSVFAVAGAGSGSFAGDFYHIILPVTEIDGVAKRYGDWPTPQKTTVSSGGQFDLTWTDIVDTRVTHYYIYRTKKDLGGPFFFVAKVAAGTEAYTDSTADADLSDTVSPIQGQWGVPPSAKYIIHSGNRNVLLNLDGEENAYIISQAAKNSHEAEGFPNNNRFTCPGKGPITGGIAIGETGESSARSNNSFITQSNSCYIHPETNPDIPLQELSATVGCISHKAIVQWNTFILFQSRRGIELWPGQGREIFLLSENISPVFDGGGPKNLTANQSDSDITYEVWRDQLLITVRDDSSFVGGNKVYILDLKYLKRNFDYERIPDKPRFTGPWIGPGFSQFLTRADGTLVLIDNNHNEILYWDKKTHQDYVDGALTNMTVKIESEGFMSEDRLLQKCLLFLHVYALSNTDVTSTIYVEFDRIVKEITLEANAYEFPWDDIEWDDISWIFDTWFQEGGAPFLELCGKWFVVVLEKTDNDTGFAFNGMELHYHAFKQRVTAR